ncbi:glycine cleavage system aminomethyltransferase GcvT [Vulgatibacter incomptus]|uniref:Aminomethyltransferase n=1 Tax=Vulgatibacter incomptus TaxID=1391653 RepID=A0A0K1P8F4_9BACT|nr:glycine cleavage system aminomethyltransferase GcvT [Vulgatibacter incomptus]AKU89808.1 Aminomethyltransferase (glycine cleavage system T protein) [Vulgatibacter incomptus]
MAPRRTPLYDAHVRHGGKLVEFAGWELPVQYKGVIDEHRAVREAAGLFDVSHMGEVFFEGEGALEACNELVTNDLRSIGDGQALYAGLLNERGGFVDDVICYRFSPTKILVCTNASNAEKDFEWMKSHAKAGPVVRDAGADFAQLALQGPKAIGILQKLTSADLQAIAFFRFAEIEVDGKPVIAARTGYTGEDGFEIFCRPGDATDLWEAILAAGKDEGLMPAGLGARDSLRTESKLALYGNDIDDEHTPLEASLGWIVKLDKPGFIGKEALVRQKADGVKRKLIGFELTERGIPRHGYPILSNGQPVGVVTSGTMSPTLQKPIGIGYVPPELASEGSTFEVEIRGKPVAARVVKTPFYKRPA